MSLYNGIPDTWFWFMNYGITCLNNPVISSVIILILYWKMPSKQSSQNGFFWKTLIPLKNAVCSLLTKYLTTKTIPLMSSPPHPNWWRLLWKPHRWICWAQRIRELTAGLLFQSNALQKRVLAKPIREYVNNTTHISLSLAVLGR